jgi:hypothetical protein
VGQGKLMAASAEGHSSSFLVHNASEQGDIKHVLTIAREQLCDLMEQRATIVKRITVLRRTLNGLVEIFGDKVLDGELRLLIKAPAGTRKSGLTDACRSVLMSSTHPLTSHEVVTRIRSTDDALLRNHKDAVATVTSILYRLQSYGETAASANLPRRRAWVWIR